MARSAATTVEAYLEELPEERREVITAVAIFEASREKRG
jgi:hypothetical protein